MTLRLVILATMMVGCVANSDNLQLGSGDVSIIATTPDGHTRTEHWQVASAWVQPYESYPLLGDSTEGFGGLEIDFSPDTSSPAPTCRDRELLTQNPPHLSIQTSRHGPASLDPGDIPFDDYGAPTIASFDIVDVTSGHVTITAADDDHITGTFDGSGGAGSDSDQISGYFDVPICWN